jgi:hypothetical protein
LGIFKESIYLAIIGPTNNGNGIISIYFIWVITAFGLMDWCGTKKDLSKSKGMHLMRTLAKLGTFK